LVEPACDAGDVAMVFWTNTGSQGVRVVLPLCTSIGFGRWIASKQAQGTHLFVGFRT